MIEVKFTGAIILTGTIEDFMNAYIKTIGEESGYYDKNEEDYCIY